MEIANKLVKETTTMAVYRRIYDLILNGNFPPGEWIRERQLKELLGVSSTPIREALRMLVQERILESVPHHGVRVKDLSIKEIRDYYELRAELEGLAAELAAQRGTIAQFKKMEELLQVQPEQCDHADHVLEAVESNNQFHDLIVEASGNQALKNTLLHLRAGISWIQVMAWNRNRDRHSLTYHQHRGIFEALMNRDAKLARSRIHDHIWDSVGLMLQSAEVGASGGSGRDI